MPDLQLGEDGELPLLPGEQVPHVWSQGYSGAGTGGLLISNKNLVEKYKREYHDVPASASDMSLSPYTVQAGGEINSKCLDIALLVYGIWSVHILRNQFWTPTPSTPCITK